jgi:hypothetical protein
MNKLHWFEYIYVLAMAIAVLGRTGSYSLAFGVAFPIVWLYLKNRK